MYRFGIRASGADDQGQRTEANKWIPVRKWGREMKLGPSPPSSAPKLKLLLNKRTQNGHWSGNGDMEFSRGQRTHFAPGQAAMVLHTLEGSEYYASYYESFSPGQSFLRTSAEQHFISLVCLTMSTWKRVVLSSFRIWIHFGIFWIVDILWHCHLCCQSWVCSDPGSFSLVCRAPSSFQGVLSLGHWGMGPFFPLGGWATHI